MVDDPTAVADPLPIPPLSPSMFSDDLTLPDDFFPFNNDDYDNNTFFDDIFTSDFNSSNPIDPQFNDFVSDPDSNLSGNRVSDVSQFLNVTSPDNNSASGEQFVDETVMISQNSNNSLPESRNENTVSSQGSGNCGGSEGIAKMNCASPDSDNSDNSVVDQKVKRESVNNNFMLKRKNDSCDVNSESRTIKYRKSNETSVTTTTEDSNPVDEKDEKKKARLIRNRESAQLSRQRKKHYVEELEDKVRAMHSTIQDLNARITYFAAENATLKQQMIVNHNGNINANGAVCAPNVMYPPHPGMAPMGYPWMPCPPYVVKSQGSQVPLVPIPRLKPQQTVSVSSQKSKKADVKKTDITSSAKSKTKTKKVASISFLGLLLFILMFGGLVPIMNIKFGGVTNGGYDDDYKLYNRQHPGRVLMGDDHVNGTNHRRVHERNASEPLVASLYVPRNDKLVKIDGNLIIHSVLASEKAMASREEEEVTKKEDSGLGVALDLVPAIPTVGRNGGRPPHMYRTSSNDQRVLSSDKENLKSKHADGKLQQWFREGLAGIIAQSFITFSLSLHTLQF